MIGGGPFNLEAGQWTDDTAMALAMGDALLVCGEFKPHAIMNAWVSWWKEGTHSCTGDCFDIGTTTVQALQRYINDGDPYAGSTAENTAGNGSLMRLCPIVLRYLDDPDLMDYATLSSLLTHAESRCVRACQLFAERIQRAINGESKRMVLAHYNGEVGNGTGYVVDAYKTALMCFSGTDNFEDAILMAANLGHDADTSAAITGQLAGAYYGVEGIPLHWCDRVAWRDEIVELAQGLYEQGQVDKPAKPANVE